MEDCEKCNQTKENCECHIPDKLKPAGLHNFVKMLMDDNGLLKEMKSDWDKEQRAEKKTYTGEEVEALLYEFSNDCIYPLLNDFSQDSPSSIVKDWLDEKNKLK